MYTQLHIEAYVFCYTCSYHLIVSQLLLFIYLFIFPPWRLFALEKGNNMQQSLQWHSVCMQIHVSEEFSENDEV